MYELPITVSVDDTEYVIRNKADYRVILDVIAAVQDPELTKEERLVTALIIFYDNIESVDDVFATFNTGQILEEAIHKMFLFVDCNSEDVGYKTTHKVIDWQQDEQLIVSAINNVANTEIRALEYLHWWTFLGYYLAIGECPLATVVGIRDKIARGKKLDDFDKQFKRDNPQYFRWKRDEQESRNIIDELWNKQ